MRAMILDALGAENALDMQDLAVPEYTDDQVLLRVQYAGIGKWDILERAGLFVDMYPGKPQFPYVLGSEGSGIVEKVGTSITNFQPGERVFGMVGARSPKQGFFAEYTVLDKENVCHVPKSLSMAQAAALAIDGGTALRGLRDALHVKSGETVMIIGASGGIGHLAVQLAKSMGAHVCAVASGEDGVSLASELGADSVFDGTAPFDISKLPNHTDAALLTTSNDIVAELIAKAKPGRIAYPYGVQAYGTIANQAKGYSAEYDDNLMSKLLSIVDKGQLTVCIDRQYQLENANEALLSLNGHHIGRTVLEV